LARQKIACHYETLLEERLQHIRFIGRYSQNPSATTFTVLRLILFRDMENSGSTPAATDVLETVSGATTVRSPINYTNRDRFSVIYDNCIIMDSSNKSGIVREEIPFTKHVRYRGTGSTTSSAAEGALFWLAVSDEPTNNPSIAIYTQSLFTDD